MTFIFLFLFFNLTKKFECEKYKNCSMTYNIKDSSNDNNISIEIYYNNNSVENVFSAEVDDIISFNFSSILILNLVY